MGEGFRALFCLLLLLVLKKDYEGLNDVFPLKGESGGPPPEKFGKSRMQEKPSITFFEAYSLYFYFSLISFLYFFLLFFKFLGYSLYFKPPLFSNQYCFLLIIL